MDPDVKSEANQAVVAERRVSEYYSVTQGNGHVQQL